MISITVTSKINFPVARHVTTAPLLFFYCSNKNLVTQIQFILQSIFVISLVYTTIFKKSIDKQSLD